MGLLANAPLSCDLCPLGSVRSWFNLFILISFARFFLFDVFVNCFITTDVLWRSYKFTQKFREDKRSWIEHGILNFFV